MKKKITLPIIVEGRYDKNTLCQIFDCNAFTTDGFGIFNSKEKQSLLRKIASGGVIVLSDSDGGGRQIRSFLQSVIPKDKIFNLYIPEIMGKEKRKKAPSKSGLLGVEGMEREVLEKIFSPFVVGTDEEQKPKKCTKMITKVDFFEDKLTGFPNSVKRRQALCAHCELPHDMTPNALLEAMNLLYGYDGYKEIVHSLFEDL